MLERQEQLGTSLAGKTSHEASIATGEPVSITATIRIVGTEAQRMRHK